MVRIQYVHWNEAEAQVQADRIRELGFAVDCDPVNVPGFRAAFRRNPADVVVIDLSRLPSHGREVAVWLTDTKATAQIPIVFLEGDERKLTAIRERLPHAFFATWKTLRRTIAAACKTRPRAVPSERRFGTQPMAGYSGTPLPKKLGIRDGVTVRVISGPEDFSATLGELPPGVKLTTAARGTADLIIWFPKNHADFVNRLPSLAKATPSGGIWIAWRKQSSGVRSDLTQSTIRELAIQAGLVDYKICAIDATWSGLKFARRDSAAT